MLGFGTRRKWKTANGKNVKIREMSDRHILRCLDLLCRMEPTGPDDVGRLGDQPEYEGYMEAFESELARRKKKGITISDFDALMGSVELMTNFERIMAKKFVATFEFSGLHTTEIDVKAAAERVRQALGGYESGKEALRNAGIDEKSILIVSVVEKLSIKA